MMGLASSCILATSAGGRVMIFRPILVISRLRAKSSCAFQALPKLHGGLHAGFLVEDGAQIRRQRLYLAGFITVAKVAEAIGGSIV